MKTDGDGIFRSGGFEEIRQKFGFVHESAVPGDHDSNLDMERVRTISEGVATALRSSGAPAAFLGRSYASLRVHEECTPSSTGMGGQLSCLVCELIKRLRGAT